MEQELHRIVRLALEEDLGNGDITTRALVGDDARSTGMFKAKSAGVVAGWEPVRQVFAMLDPDAQWETDVPDGKEIPAGIVVGVLKAKTGAILSGERTALNIMQRMSGIATRTRRFVEAVKGTQAVILDTRKTAPGIRLLDKMAVRIGGGTNHRFGLYDMVLIKNNHIAAAGGIVEAVSRVRSAIRGSMKVEIEVRTLQELEKALPLGIDRILLDNMNVHDLQRAVNMTGGRVPLEASGSISLENVAAVARTGVQFISVGQLTHSVQAMDISLSINGGGAET